MLTRDAGRLRRARHAVGLLSAFTGLDMTDRSKRPRDDERAEQEDVILLKDLAPRDEVKGGARKMRFGEPQQPPRNSLRKRRS